MNWCQHNAWHTVTTQEFTISGNSNKGSNSMWEQHQREKTMEKIFNMYKSLPINLILASQEKPQLLTLATEHGAHS